MQSLKGPDVTPGTNVFYGPEVYGPGLHPGWGWVGGEGTRVQPGGRYPLSGGSMHLHGPTGGTSINAVS